MDAPQYVHAEVPCMFPVTKRKGSNITILKRGIKYYQN
jgi:hypothetical protein